ncbi:hypothetical protein CBM2595_A30574 [Cupriavidus taiwanensis]|nr:hypothetical protein CBM2595_A30574 [Cupriavidus taiwanensis]
MAAGESRIARIASWACVAGPASPNLGMLFFPRLCLCRRAKKNPRSLSCRGFLVLLVLHRTEYWWSRRPPYDCLKALSEAN